MEITYQGVNITVNGNGYFVATIDGSERTKETMREIKEWIDKEIAANVKTITINLPVCAIVQHKEDRFSAQPRTRVIRTAITGINRQTGAIQCKDKEVEFEMTTVVPDSDENFALCEKFVIANKAFGFFRHAVVALKVDGPGGRIDASHYMDVLNTITSKYQEKVASGPIVNEAVAKFQNQNPDVYKAALEQISGLWPEPPNCATVNPEWVGERDGKARAILLEAALAIARTALGKTCGV
jgi:hypothetical protein